MIKVTNEEYKASNYLMTQLKDGSWKRDSENGVQYIVVNNLDTVDRDCQGLVNITDGIDKEHTIYAWGIDRWNEKWTEIDSSDPNYDYLSQYLKEELTEMIKVKLNERIYQEKNGYPDNNFTEDEYMSYVKDIKKQLVDTIKNFDNLAAKQIEINEHGDYNSILAAEDKEDLFRRCALLGSANNLLDICKIIQTR